MAFKFSTGLRNGMLGATGFKALMDGFRVRIYAGTTPDTADAALGGATLLCELTVSGDGTTNLNFGSPSGAIISKAAGEVWSGTAVATGDATFFRAVKTTDTGAASTTDLRIQGTVGELGADMNLSDATFTSGTPFTLNYFSVALPTA